MTIRPIYLRVALAIILAITAYSAYDAFLASDAVDHDSFDSQEFCENACIADVKGTKYACANDDKVCLSLKWSSFSTTTADEKCLQYCGCAEYCRFTYNEDLNDCFSANSYKCTSAARAKFITCSNRCPTSLIEANLKEKDD